MRRGVLGEGFFVPFIKICIFEYMYIQGLQLAMEVSPAGPMSTS